MASNSSDSDSQFEEVLDSKFPDSSQEDDYKESIDGRSSFGLGESQDYSFQSNEKIRADGSCKRKMRDYDSKEDESEEVEDEEREKSDDLLNLNDFTPPNKRVKHHESQDLYNSEESDGERPRFASTPESGHSRLQERCGKRFLEAADVLQKSKRIKVFCSKGKETREEDATSDYSTASSSSIERGQRLMAKMGYTKGKGLGKHQQGRLEPVEASKQLGRRGLGHSKPELEIASKKWDPSQEEVGVREDIKWLENDPTLEPPSQEELKTWMVVGPSKETIEDETMFCNPEVVESVINSKTIFDRLDKKEMRNARTRSNPYETIRGAFFLNRAAVKMANMDKACDFMFTRPKDLGKEDLLYFADVCAGPGGFSEYVLWRRKWFAKGFGFTLKAENDFKLDDFYAGSPETFHPFYGPREDGDVYNPENQKAFRDLVMRQTAGVGVHFMMSDGGFSVEGRENIQEILSKQLYLCQCLVALMVVREGGHFVTKLFDLFTPFSAGLVYLMHRCFDRVSIFKPNTSRPANSERYLICQGRKPCVDGVMSYLANVNRVLLRNKSNEDVVELVPLEILTNCNFYEYLKESNDTLGRKQVTGLMKIAAFTEDPTLFESRQAEMRKECLKYWELPDDTRTTPRSMNPQDKIKSMLSGNRPEVLEHKADVLTKENVKETIFSGPYNWYCVPSALEIGDKRPTFYLGMGRSKVYFYNQDRCRWDLLKDSKVELLPNTLVYGEMVKELKHEGKAQSHTWALHIIDSFILGSEDVSKRSIQQRHELTKKFCEALWKPTYSEYLRVKPKDLHAVEYGMDSKLRLKPCVMKNGCAAEAYYGRSRSPLDYDYESNERQSCFIPRGLIFLKTTFHPWSRNLSKSTGYPYYFNTKTGATHYEKDAPQKSYASFVETFKSRIVWPWSREAPTFRLNDFLQLAREHCIKSSTSSSLKN